MIFMNDISQKTTRNSVIAELSFGIQEIQRGKRKKTKTKKHCPAKQLLLFALFCCFIVFK